ncbi:AAA family ATPase [Streptomyces sp. NPDC059740]|uniref:AAA family ATPase n=1 Tax=Streptomyces sp. NPDC059740 TaxID=3346926 RepID=UPI0036577AE3
MTAPQETAPGAAAPPGAPPAAGPGPHLPPPRTARAGPGPGARVVDLRGATAPGPLRLTAGDVLLVSGLPGSGKSTLIHRCVPAVDSRGRPVVRLDSQEVRLRFARGACGRLPYALYRPLVRLAHYRALARALRGAHSLVVHDCGAQPWVRRWVAAAAGRRRRRTHLLLLDVGAAEALAGQRARGRTVSAYAFRRHRRAVHRLVGAAERGEAPPGCARVLLLDRTAADVLPAVTFT